MDIYLPHTVPLEGERKESKQIPEVLKEKQADQGVDPLGENFKQLEGCPKCTHIESAALK